MSYGDYMNVAQRPYNAQGSRLVDHNIMIKNNTKDVQHYMYNVLDVAVKKTQSNAVFGKDSINITTASRAQFKFIRGLLNKINVKYIVK